MILPSGIRDLTKFAQNVIEICRVSQGTRAAVYRNYGEWIETGAPTGGLALANMLNSHIDRLRAFLFSPTDLRFDVDFETTPDDRVVRQAGHTAKIITREWERKNIDMTFGEGVKESLKYGACIMKQLISMRNNAPQFSARLVMPWNFGVYNEGVNDLGDQEAMCETAYLTKHEVWRRIAHLPDAEKLFQRIITSASKEEGAGQPNSFMHQVLSTAVLDVNLENATQPMPGGIVTLNNDPNYATLGPEVAADLYPMHELQVKDDARDDYTTIQLIEPDILIAPRMKRVNLFCPDSLQYTLIQPNRLAGYIWGRSEVVDLLMLQQLLSSNLGDIKRLMGVQFDKILGFAGADGITDEIYDAFRGAGYVNMGQGGSVTDLTPKMPEGALALVKTILDLMDMVSGFDNILSGRGESGVRSGNHADTLMKTASPRLRDRALLVERQCASAGEQTLCAMEAKDGRTYWTDDKDKDGSSYLISQLPEDRRVTVDSHSTSPIYKDDHEQLVAFGLKTDLIDGEDAIDALPFPNRDRLKDKWRARQAAKAALIKAHPELLEPHGKKK